MLDQEDMQDRVEENPQDPEPQAPVQPISSAPAQPAQPEAPPSPLPPPWEEVAPHFKQAFPLLDQDELKNRYDQARQLSESRLYHASPEAQSERQADYWMRSTDPMQSVKSSLENVAYKEARTRLDTGQAAGSDFNTIAEYEQRQEEDAKRSTAEKLGGALASVPGTAAKAALPFGLSRLFLEQTLEGATAKAAEGPNNGEFYEPHNLLPSAGMAGAQALVLGSLGKWTSGIKNAGARFLASLGVGVGEMEAVKTAGAALDNVLPDAWKTRTEYGMLGHIAQGKYGDALQDAVMEPLTVAAFIAIGGNHYREKAAMSDQMTAGEAPGAGDAWHKKFFDDMYEDINSSFKRSKERGDSPQEAASSLKKTMSDKARDILGVGPEATAEEIKTAWRASVRKTHPDVGGSAEEFARTQWAYEYLNGRAAKGGPPPGKQPEPPGSKPQEPGPQAAQQAQQPQQPAQAPPEPAYEPHPSQVAEADPARLTTRSRGRASAVETPETMPMAGEGQRQLPAPASAPPDPAVGDRAYHIADYKNPGHSVKAALGILDQKGSFPKPSQGGLWTWNGKDPVSMADAQLPPSGVAFMIDKATTKADLKPRGTDILHAATSEGNTPVSYDPGLRSVVYGGKGADADFAKLREKVDEINKERADASLMKEYGHDGALPPVKLEAWAEHKANARGETEAKPSLLDRMKAKGKQDVATPSQETQAPKPIRSFTDYTPPDEYTKAGLTKDEAYIHEQLMANGRSLRDVAKDTVLRIKSQEGVRQAQLRAASKLGLVDAEGNPKSSTELLRDRYVERAKTGRADETDMEGAIEEHAHRAVAEAAAQGYALDLNVARKEIKAQAKDWAGQEDAYQNKWKKFFEKAVKDGREFTHAEYAELNGKAARGEDPPTGTQRKPVNEASVRREDTSGLREDTAQRPETTPAQNEGAQVLGASADAGNAQAASDKLKESHAKAEAEAVQDIKRAGYPESEAPGLLEQARGIAQGEIAPELRAAQSKQGSQSNGQPAVQAGSGPGAVSQSVNGAAPAAPVPPGNGSPQPGPIPGGGGNGRSLEDHVKNVALEFMHDDGAAVNLDTLKDKMKWVASAAHYTGQAVRRLAGQMFPDTTSVDRVSGEKLAQWANAEVHAIEQGDWYGHEVIGFPEGSTESVRLGAVITEMALGYTRAHYGREATRTSNLAGMARQNAAQATNPADKAKYMAQAADYARQATEAMNARLKVTSVIGMHGSPFKTLAEFQAAKAEPVVQQQLKNWRDKLSYVLDDNYRESIGLSPLDPIDAPTQMPGLTVNLMALQEGDKPSSTMGSQGNPKNLRMKKNPFSNQRAGAAEAYELDAHKIIQNSFNKGTPNAARAKFVRTAVDRKIGELAPRGSKIEGMTEFIDAKPPRGTQDAGPRDTSFFIKDKAAGELRTVLDIDKQNAATKIFSALSQVPTIGALSSFVEVATHGANLATALQAPGMLHTFAGAVQIAKNEWNQLFHNHDFQREVMALSEIGATKSRGMESGTIVGAARKIGMAMFDKEIPKSVDKFDPTYWSGKALHHFDKLVRVSLGHAHDRIAAVDPSLKTETSKRDFINQWAGMYNRRAQNCVVAWLRASGFGPFATAATGQTVGAIRNLAGSPRLNGGATSTQARLRLSFLARLVGTLVGGVFAYNYARWGRIDGDDDTPFGNIKLDPGADGKHRSFDVMRFTGVTRGLRAIGGLAVIEGMRKGEAAGTIKDHAIGDMGHTLAHPFTGPLTQLGYTTWTGKDTMGRQIADKVSTAKTPAGIAKAAREGKPTSDSSQFALNFKAAMENMNQPYATLFGKDRGRRNDVTAEETVSKLAGPFGVKYRDISKRKR